MTPREWFRRLCFGLDTVLSLDRKGFFIPYRHARDVAAPARYPALFESSAHGTAQGRWDLLLATDGASLWLDRDGGVRDALAAARQPH